MNTIPKLAIWRSHPSAFLLAAQLMLLAMYALFNPLRNERALIGAFGMLILVLIVWTIMHSPAPNWIAWTLVLPALLLSLLSIFPWGAVLDGWGALLSAGLYFYAAASLIAYMLEDTVVTTDEMVAAGAAFTLLAWGFAYLYLVCQAWVPNSFSSSLISDRPLAFVELLSLSFTNLTATGLSDIVAASIWARVVVMLEQFVGVGYVALVVSRLVGLMGQRRRAHNLHLRDPLE